MSPPEPHATPLASSATAAALEWPSLLALVAALAATDLGQERLLSLAPHGDPEGLERHRRRYREAERLRAEGRLVPSFDQPLGDLLERLATGRPPLGGGDLVRLAALVRATGAAARRIAAADPTCPELARLADGLADLAPLEREIAARLDRRGEVRDDASPELVALRRRIRGARDQLYRDLGGFVGEHRESLGDETIPMRGGRLMVVLDAGARGRVPGLVHGRSATGRSFYFEPLSAVEQNNTLQQASEDEEAERRRILAELVRAARAALPDLARHADLLAELDLLEASATFAGMVDGRLPDPARRHELVLRAARHPLLDPRLADLRREVLGHPGHASEIVPLDLAFDAERRALVVTGPNAGGKTVALKTVGLLALAAQSGLPVPAAAGTRFPHLAALVATVGDEQDLLAERSTFSGRLLRLREAWEESSPDALLLVDELGSGTDPEEGSALGVSFLEGIVERGSLAVITTHLTQVAAAALETPGATCAAMEFDPASGEPTYHLLPGPPGGSEALALARRLGLPAAWLDRAEARLGRQHRDLQRLLGEVEEVRRELAAERDRSAAAAADAETLTARLAAQEAALIEERRRVGKRLQGELEAFRRQTLERLREEGERMRGEIESGRRKGVEAAAVERLFAEAPEVAPPEPGDEADIEGELVAGAGVRHRLLGWEGTLEKLDRGRAEVAVRGKRLQCRPEELALVATGGRGAGTAAGEGRAFATAPAPASVESRGRRVSLSRDVAAAPAPPELNLIGERVEPALDRLDEYLDRALLAGGPEVRVVHGHGSGRLRQAVREHLRGHPAVAAQRPGERNEGGNGATVVTLRGA